LSNSLPLKKYNFIIVTVMKKKIVTPSPVIKKVTVTTPVTTQ